MRMHEMEKWGLNRGYAMNFWDVLYKAAKNGNVNTTDIGPKLGLNRTFVSSSKAQKVTPRLDNACRMLDVCGYGLYAIPHDSAPTDALQITPLSE